jgi:hypothetical protein
MTKKSQYALGHKSQTMLERQREAALECWEDPKYRRKVTKGVRASKLDPEYQRRISAASKKMWKDPSYRKRVIKHVKAALRTPEWSKERTEMLKELWKDPEYRKRVLHSRKISSRKRIGQIPTYYTYYYESKRGRIYMRSSWEVAFAYWLDHHGIRWEYEPRSFYLGKGKWGSKSYTPDFYLIDQDEYVELKGYCSPEFKLKLKRFHEMYPEIKLYVFFGRHLRAAGMLDSQFVPSEKVTRIKKAA